jgi:hypothetical protein
MVVRMLRHLLGRGANPDLGRFLWRLLSRPAEATTPAPRGGDGMPSPPLAAKYGVNDLLRREPGR